VVQDVAKDNYSCGGAREKGIFPHNPNYSRRIDEKFPGIFS